MSRLSNIAPKISAILGAGQHRVVLLSAEITDSLTVNGEEKERRSPWSDRTEQLMVKFGSVDNKGVVTERFSFDGFVSAKDKNYVAQQGDVILSSTDKDGNSYDEQYVCRKQADGSFTRIPSDEKSKTAQDIIAKLAGDLATGKENAEEAFQFAIANKSQLTITVKENNGKMRVTGTKKGMPTEATVVAPIPEGDL